MNYNGIIIDDILVKGNGALSTNNLDRKPIVSFPNPANNTITFDIKEATSYQQIKVYSITGELVLIKENGVSNNGQISIDINNLSPGIYQVEISDKTNKYFGKFSKK